MSDEPVTVTEVEARRADWVDEHLATYLSSGGRTGQVVDFTPIGGHWFSTTLLLRTVGRKSGLPRVTALTYGSIDGRVIIIASKGGADIHPAWFHNIAGHETVDIQIGGQALRTRWHQAEGEERADLWAFMERIYPPYRDYQAGTTRRLPLIVLEPYEEIEPFPA